MGVSCFQSAAPYSLYMYTAPLPFPVYFHPKHTHKALVDISSAMPACRGARKGRGLVVSPKDYSTKYRWVAFPILVVAVLWWRRMRACMSAHAFTSWILLWLQSWPVRDLLVDSICLLLVLTALQVLDGQPSAFNPLWAHVGLSQLPVHSCSLSAFLWSTARGLSEHAGDGQGLRLRP